MPSGAKKRKAAKKKQLNNPSTANPNRGENDNQELNSSTAHNPSVEAVKRDDDSPETKSNDANYKEGITKFEFGSKSKNSRSSNSSSNSSSDGESESTIVEKNVVVVESMPVSPIVDPVKPADPLVEDARQVFDEMPNEKKEEQTVVDGVSSSTSPKNLISEDNETDKQASAPLARRTTPWKSCCGLFELFSGSER